MDTNSDILEGQNIKENGQNFDILEGETLSLIPSGSGTNTI